MVRLLLLVAIVVVIALLVRRLVSSLRKPDARERDAAPPPGSPQAKLVRCAQCGAFVPQGDTVPVDDGFRCAAGCKPR